MNRSPKVISEEIDDAQMQMDRLECTARGIIAKAKADQRELFPAEAQEFDRLTKNPGGPIYTLKNQRNQLRNELAQAESSQRQLIISHSQNRGQGQSNMYQHPSGTVYNQMNSGAPDRVLPVNGVLPGDGQPRYSPYGRMAKLKAFRDEQTAFDSGQWYKAIVAREVNHAIDQRAEDYCRSIGIQITNVGTEGSGPAGGYLTPAPISSAIIEVRERVGIARQVCNVQPTSGDTLTVPKKDGGLTVYIVGEGNAITASDKQWASVSCNLKKRACLSYLSQELSEDALINIVDNIVSEQAYALALQEDDELVNGTGASTYGGIQGLLSSIGSAGVSTAATGHDTWPELDMADMTACIGKLPDRYFPYEPSWVCSHSFFNSVMVRLAFAAGGVSAAEVMGGTPNVRSFLGYKVYLTPKMPIATATATKCALFGSFDQGVLMADRGAIRMQRSDDIKFVEDLIALKAVSRYDMTVHDAGDSTNAGAYVALKTAS